MSLRIVVVIPTYGRPGDLSRCLGGLAAQSRCAERILVAIRDDDAASGEVVAECNRRGLAVQAISVGTMNASAARNRCIGASDEEIVAMIDDDAIPRPDWLATIAARFTADAALSGIGGPDWTGGVTRPAHERPAVVGRVQWWGRRIGHHHLGSRVPMTVEWLKGANMAFRRSALRGITLGDGLRGDGAQFAEDVALSLAVTRRGGRLRYDPAVAVDHYPGQLVAGSDHRALGDRQSLSDAAHNDTVATLEYLPPLRRLVFLVWSVLIGTRLLPGLGLGLFLAAPHSRAALRRCAVVVRGRWSGWQTWRHHHRTPDPDHLTICLVTHVVTRGDGQGRVNYELARHLVRHGHVVTLVASRVSSDLASEPGILWMRVPMPPRIPEPLRWLLFATQVRWLLRGRRLDQYDVVHLNGAIAPIHADVNTSHFVHAGWRRAAPSHTPHRQGLARHQRLLTWLLCPMERRAYRKSGRVVAVSETVRQSLCHDVALAPDQVDVIHTGVDPTEFHPRASDESRRFPVPLPADSFCLVFVGDARSPRKNLDLVLRALVHLDSAVRLIVIGATRTAYLEMAQRLGVASRTHFLGARRDVADWYRVADVVFCTSHYEPASLVLLEAMASGAPVIATAQVGNAAFIDDGVNGFLLASNDDIARAAAVVRALRDDPALQSRIGQAARRTARRLSWTAMGEHYEALYHRVTPVMRSAGGARS